MLGRVASARKNKSSLNVASALEIKLKTINSRTFEYFLTGYNQKLGEQHERRTYHQALPKP